MKNLLFFCVFFGFLFSCQEAPKKTSPSTTDTDERKELDNLLQNDADLIAISGVLHGFYAWYDAFQRDETRNIIFTSDKGKHLTLDQARLDQYFANLKAGGFISDDFIENEKVILKKCEKLWQNEDKEDVPSCLDADRYFCAQDWDIEFWTKAPVSAEGLGTDNVEATMSGSEGGGPREQKFELKKENGKWMITKIECDLGVE